MEKICVLDHGYVQYVDHMGQDSSVVRVARQSYDACDKTGTDVVADNKLLRYLWKHKHTTPFESVVFTFHVKAPIFVVRQWHRHRTQSYNEMSARYTELLDEFYVPVPWHVGTQDKDNRQKRNLLTEREFCLLPKEKQIEAKLACDALHMASQSAFQSYQALLATGVPRELARSVLPVNTYTKMTTTVNLLNLFRFLALRVYPDAQYEIRVYAEAILKLIEPIVPECVRVFKDTL